MQSQAYRCLFCGQDTVFCLEKEQPSALSKLLFVQDPQVSSKDVAKQYTCSNCGLIFTQQEITKEEERRSRQEFYQNADNPDEQITEEETLAEAKQTLKKSLWDDELNEGMPSLGLVSHYTVQKKTCDDVLDMLFRHGFPFQHPLEFMIYRDLCQAGSLLTCIKDRIGDRYQHLDNMLSDVQHLSYFLPKDEEELFRILSGICEALLMLGDMVIYCHTDNETTNRRNRDFFTDQTGRKRAAIIGLFADQLEERKDSAHGTDYLKMALKLWHKILEQAYESNVYLKLGLGSDEMTQIPQQMRQQIVAKIQQLNDLVLQRDPGFIPDALPELPLVIPAYIKAITCVICIVLLGLGIWAMIVYPSVTELAGKVGHGIIYCLDFGTGNQNIVIISGIVYSAVFIFIYDTVIKGKILPAVYHYFSTRK